MHPIILDTDIGSDVDDALALAMLGIGTWVMETGAGTVAEAAAELEELTPLVIS